MTLKCGQENCNEEAVLEFDWNGENVVSCQDHFDQMKQVCDAIGTPHPIPRKLGSSQ